jgi:chromosomal replication initiation ATPase DnaA
MSPEEKEVVLRAARILIEDWYTTRLLIEEALDLRKQRKYQTHIQQVLDVLVQEVAAHFQIPVHIFKTPTRTRPHVYHRQLGTAAIWRVTQYRKEEIAQAMGFKDRAAVRYCISTISKEESQSLVDKLQAFIVHLNITL